MRIFQFPLNPGRFPLKAHSLTLWLFLSFFLIQLDCAWWGLLTECSILYITSINHQQPKHSISCGAVIRGSLNHTLNGLDLCSAFHRLLPLLERHRVTAPWWPARTWSGWCQGLGAQPACRVCARGAVLRPERMNSLQGFPGALCTYAMVSLDCLGILVQKICHSDNVNSCSYCIKVVQMCGKSWLCFDWKNVF